MNRLAAILPAPRGRTSGGFLVNDQFFSDSDIERVEANDAEDLASACARLGAETAVIVDSLFLFDRAAAAILARETEQRAVLLLAHSLPSLLPDTSTRARRLHLGDERVFLERAAGAIAPSEFMLAALARRGLDRRLVRIVPPAPICDGRSERSRPTEREPGPHRVLTVANWRRAKGLADAAFALAGLSDIDWSWTVVGGRDGCAELEAEVRHALARHSVERRLRIVPALRTRDLALRYAEADLFLLPSYMESYGLAFAEARTFGLPVVGYRAAAVPEVVRGTLVPPADIAALARALRETIADPQPIGSHNGPAGDTAHLPDRWEARSRLRAAVRWLLATGKHA
ncbi:MAG: glycosyltransferase family 4 protein [Spirochaetota bacterium]